MRALRKALRDLPDDVFFDLLEGDDAYLVVFDVPGASPATVDVEVRDGALYLETRREERFPDDYEYVEENRNHDRELRIGLPSDVGTEIETVVERGVVEVRLPKQETATKIDVVEDESE